jgi:hypothetical protein
MKLAYLARQHRLSLSTLLLPFLSMLLLLGLLHHNLSSRLRFPDGADQDVHVASARNFIHNFTFEAKCPLYTAWLSLFCALGKDDPARCFLLEKYVSVFLLSLLTAYLGTALFDKRTGLLLGFWMLNAKYLLLEPNGSNALAAIMFVASALSLCLHHRAIRLPLSLFFFFLSTLARPEMRLPFLIVLMFVLVRGAIRLARRRKRAEKGAAILPGRAVSYWAAAIILSLALSVIINNNLDSNRWSISNAFFLGFAVNYVARHNLAEQFPRPWASAYEIIPRAMPEVKDPIDAPGMSGLIHTIQLYPQEFITHVLYNVKVAARVLPAMVLGFDSRLLMLLALAAHLGSYFFIKGSRRENYRQTPRALWQELLVWGLAATLVVPVSFVILVLWRYYIPLIPIGMIAVCFIIHRVLDRIQGSIHPRD